MPLKTRPDIVDPRFTKTTEILKNAAVKHGQFFAVPKVKENDVTNWLGEEYRLFSCALLRSFRLDCRYSISN